ncbi:TPA: hypothetical protein SCR51_000610 [Citrobacter freundii]|uniref:hypothetical protein n=1 Tax=Citrobacter freundii TaxID=546 RepID=UPI0008FCF6EF|nr:hypothetical protein BEH70_15360 [Citrobacter freundii]HCB2882364.1 hypothetical protein [Citrobacter freundii]HEG1880293.1 hypothetical protein [Citrobacter freundii]
MKTISSPLLHNAKSGINSVICLLIALENSWSTLDETTLEGAISGIRMLATDAYSDMDRAEEISNSLSQKMGGGETK